MTRFLLFLCLVALAFAACSKKAAEPEKDTIEYFRQHLKADMNFTAITDTFGAPDDDRGSGIHIYVYRLKDDTSVWIGYTDRILYARHMDANNQQIAVLI